MNKRQKKKRKKLFDNFKGWDKPSWKGLRKFNKEYEGYLTEIKFKTHYDDKKCKLEF